MKMMSLELEDILDEDDMDKADKANVKSMVGDFKIIRLMWQMSAPL